MASKIVLTESASVSDYKKILDVLEKAGLGAYLEEENILQVGRRREGNLEIPSDLIPLLKTLDGVERVE